MPHGTNGVWAETINGTNITNAIPIITRLFLFFILIIIRTYSLEQEASQSKSISCSSA